MGVFKFFHATKTFEEDIQRKKDCIARIQAAVGFIQGPSRTPVPTRENKFFVGTGLPDSPKSNELLYIKNQSTGNEAHDIPKTMGFLLCIDMLTRFKIFP